MNITPDQARELLDGATTGPWEAYDPGDNSARLYSLHDERLVKHVKPQESAGSYMDRADGELAAAAPDLAQTIAGMTEEWGVDADGNALFPVNEEWHSSGEYFTECRADAEAVRDRMVKLNPHVRYRLVRRLVGPAEAINGD